MATETPTVDAKAATKLKIAEDAVVALTKERDALRDALQTIVDTPFGCPMCDSGALRGTKPHWDDCGYGKAQALLAKREK